ncbi:hypothetical protein E2C01_057889 [Portunus trituberculatus]|uniref:Uncharacterized protein n=1 Tax=Portunus trituberculatus TaxID=210409 RepID=A0A5B7H1R0_PORTR|nr:hypothetical protein [Portunus trituberculatus]
MTDVTAASDEATTMQTREANISFPEPTQPAVMLSQDSLNCRPTLCTMYQTSLTSFSHRTGSSPSPTHAALHPFYTSAVFTRTFMLNYRANRHTLLRDRYGATLISSTGTLFTLGTKHHDHE